GPVDGAAAIGRVDLGAGGAGANLELTPAGGRCDGAEVVEQLGEAVDHRVRLVHRRGRMVVGLTVGVVDPGPEDDLGAEHPEAVRVGGRVRIGARGGGP